MRGVSGPVELLQLAWRGGFHCDGLPGVPGGWLVVSAGQRSWLLNLAPFGPAFFCCCFCESAGLPRSRNRHWIAGGNGVRHGYVLLPKPGLAALDCVARPVPAAFFIWRVFGLGAVSVLAGLFEIVAGRRWVLGCVCFLSGLIGPLGTIWFGNPAGRLFPGVENMSGGAAFCICMFLYYP